MFGGNRYYSNEALNSNSLFKIQSETIREIALKGNAIFVGRASDYVLRDFDCCLNIFITAPKKARALSTRALPLRKPCSPTAPK